MAVDLRDGMNRAPVILTVLPLTVLPTRRILITGVALMLLGALYLANLTGMGMVSTDEPRYADIGRAMAVSGDWITPRLWGHPWFEKPPLLYWLVAAGFRFGLGPDLAPRLPVALLSLGFLVFFWFRLRSLWDSRVAGSATAILATSAGWLAASHVAITDIPVAVLFSTAVLLAIGEGPRRITLIAAILGLGTLAKSLLPLVFFLPVLLVDYRRWRHWLHPAPVLAFLAVSLPWHIACYLRNGFEFPRVLFLEQQFGRFTSSYLPHPQHWWYYVPVLLLLLYPWFPLVVLMPRDLRDSRLRTLWAVVAFGFVFLSSVTNKLPAYPLPLLPTICALIGVGIAPSKRMSWPVGAAVALLGLLPFAASLLPTALATGLKTAQLAGNLRGLYWLGASTLSALALYRFLPRRMLAVAALLTAGSFVWFQFHVFPSIDRIVSARPLWQATHPVCTSGLHRRLQYGLYYYAGRELPECDILDQSALPVVKTNRNTTKAAE